MLIVYDAIGARLSRREGRQPVGDATVWLDLLNPTQEEDDFVEHQLGITIPTRAETREIEASNRLYSENGAHYMTALVMYNSEALLPSTSTITFILAGKRLVTVRYSEPRAFPQFIARVDKGDLPCNSAPAVAIGLIESIIHRAADLIERIQDEVERTVQSVFELKGGQATRGKRLDVLLRSAGKEGDVVSRAQECAFSLDRLLTYLGNAIRDRHDDPQLTNRISIAHRDVHTLMEHMRFLTGRIAFLLDATLGMINIEQNGIIKIFSVASVALMPPTLIASIYGMNFKHMPELDWWFGYPLAIGAMVLSAILPFIFFRRKGWF